MITAQHVQDFLDARRKTFANPNAFREARRVLLQGDMTPFVTTPIVIRWYPRSARRCKSAYFESV